MNNSAQRMKVGLMSGISTPCCRSLRRPFDANFVVPGVGFVSSVDTLVSPSFAPGAVGAGFGVVGVGCSYEWGRS